jgi:glycerol-3-phosphate responsive antiterminator
MELYRLDYFLDLKLEILFFWAHTLKTIREFMQVFTTSGMPNFVHICLIHLSMGST